MRTIALFKDDFDEELWGVLCASCVLHEAFVDFKDDLDTNGDWDSEKMHMMFDAFSDWNAWFVEARITVRDAGENALGYELVKKGLEALILDFGEVKKYAEAIHGSEKYDYYFTDWKQQNSLSTLAFY